MFKESIIGKLFYLVLSLFSTFKYSFIYTFLSSFKNAFAKIFYGSIIYKFFYYEDKIQYFCEKSLVFKFIDKIIISVVSSISNVYKSLKKINKGSINNLIYNFLNRNSYLRFQNILAVLIVIMVCVPGNRWNNLYGLIIAMFVLFLYFAVLISGKNFSIRIAKFDFFMIIFMLSTLLAVIISNAVGDSIRVFMFFVTSFIFMFVIWGSIKKEEDLNKFVGIISIGLILTSLYCIYQGIVGVEIDVRLTDLNANQGMPGRAYSTFENPNNYAEYLVMFMPFMAAFALNQKDKKKKALWLIMLLVPFMALLYTYSRSCWVSFAISVVVFIAFYNYKLIPLIALLGIIAIPFLPESILNRILTIGSMKDTSNHYRILIWEGALKMLKGNFVTGIGLGPQAYSLLYPSFAHASAVLAPHSHMLFMEVLVEMGLLGFISFMIFWVITLKRLITVRIRHTLSPEIKNYVCASLASFTGIIFVSGVEYIWFYPRTMFMFFTMAGIILAALNISRKQKHKI